MSDPTPLSAVISELIARKGLARVQGNAQLVGVWKTVAGDRISSRTKVLGLKRGVLEVAVDNSALMNELASFHKTALLHKLQKEYSEHRITDIRFKLRTDMNLQSGNSGQ
jgi:predicted nucleic acid-binding Zn ribbon protein